MVETTNMETYLRRTYMIQRKDVLKGDFPFWDYRSRRGAFSSSNSSFSSCSNSSYDGSSIASSNSSRSEAGSENISISDHSDTDSLSPCDQSKMTLQFVTDTNNVCSMEALFQPIINWVDPDLHILKITDQSDRLDNTMASLKDLSARIPSVAVMIFLQEEGSLGFERIQTAKRYFEKSPWKFHHSEHVHRGTINPYPYNNQDFYYTSEDLPLWAIRQVHAGKEFVRIVLFASETQWQQMTQFYKLIIGSEPDVKREDFCLFTVVVFPNFNVQLALKKLKGDTKPRVLESVRVNFRVNDLSNIIPLLPNVCRPLSDTRWETTDNDGNVVILETPRLQCHSNSSFSDRGSLSDKSSLSGRNSLSGEINSANRRRRDGTQTFRTVRERSTSSSSTSDSRGNPTSVSAQRTRSLMANDRLLEKLKLSNIAYKRNAEIRIKERHSNMKVDYNAVFGATENKIIESHVDEDIGDESSMIQGLKSFYV